MSQISSEIMRAALDAAFPGLPPSMTLDEAERRVRAGLEAVVPLIEANALREAGDSIERHVESYEVVARLAVQRLKDAGRDEAEVRQRQRLERRYVRGLLAAMDDVYELAEAAEKRAEAARGDVK